MVARTSGATMAHPPDDLDQIATAATEHEQMPGKRVLLQHGLGLRGQRRKALAHVRHPGRKPDPRVGRNRDQTDRPRISRANASGSYLPLIRIRCPPASSISM